MIYLVRHGETAWNKERKVLGSTDIPLNEYGVYLAEVTGEALSEIVRFDYCFSSPLSRAYKTAEIILEKQNNKIPIVKDDRIIEMGFGVLEGEDNLASPKELKVLFSTPEKFVPAKDGETLEELSERVSGFFDEIANKKEFEDKNILITAHAAVIAAAMNYIKDKADFTKFWGDGVHRNCAVTKLETKDGKISVISEGEIYYECNQDWVDELKKIYGK